MKNILALLLVLTLVGSVAACSGESVVSANGFAGELETEAVGQSSGNISDAISVAYDSDDEDSSGNGTAVSYIKLEGNQISVEGDGVVVDDNRIAITSAGTYSISGTLNDGQIVVRSEDTEIVKLVLNGMDLTCTTSAPIYIFKAKKVVITLADGTQNFITDGDNYNLDDAESDEPNAAIYSKCDLTFNGNGSLTVNANFSDAITGKDELKITGGNITVNSVSDGIRGRDCIAIKGGNIIVNAAEDGMKSNNDEDAEKGFIFVEGGSIEITAGDDGIQAETSVSILDGEISITTGGGSVNSINTVRNDNPRGMGNTAVADSTPSSQGIMAATGIIIEGGSIDIDSADDCINSDGSVTISGGTITLASGDDSIHANNTLEISGGNISTIRSYEGLESKSMIIRGGNIHLVASDDGINVGADSGAFPMNGSPVQNMLNNFSSENYLNIEGGYLHIDAAGDGIDVNGSITMTAGTVIVNGPTNNGNGALDHISFKMTGGFLLAVGSSGMAMAPGTASAQYSMLLNLEASQPAKTMLHIESADGAQILTFIPTKAYQSVVLSMPELKNGSTYTVYCGGSSSGTETDGLYSGGTYTGGTQVSSFTISSMVTSIGSKGDGQGGIMPPQGGNMAPPGRVHR